MDDLATVGLADLDDDQRLELLRDAEDLTRTLAAVSAGVQVDFRASQVRPTGPAARALTYEVDPAAGVSGRAATVWARLLYTDPVTGVLTARDPRRRLCTGNLRATLVARGRYCASRCCRAPVRHVVHVRRRSEGGGTTEDNGRDLCARCNLARERPRHADPPRGSYLGSPPILDTFLGRPPRGAPGPVRAGRPGERGRGSGGETSRLN